jgi:chitinase
LRKAGKKFNLSLAVGGWTWSAKFSDAVSTPTTRATMVSSIVALFTQWPGLFNGVSLDWEYLSNDGVNYGLDGNVARASDPANFCAFVGSLRAALGPGFRIAMCVTAAPEKIKMPVRTVAAAVDDIHVMTYDFADGNWPSCKLAAHHTNLRKAPYCPYSVEEAVAAWTALGAPASKLFIGVALYSRGFCGTSGIGQPCTGGSPDLSWDSGVVDYKALPVKGASERWDPVAHATYSYDPARRVLNSYDSVQSVQEKCAFVLEKGLGGIIVWDSSGDVPVANPRSITKAISAKFKRK